MSFTTNIFLLVFLPTSIICYALLFFIDSSGKYKLNNIFLVLISVLFYRASGSISIKVFLLYILIVWLFGKLLDRFKSKLLLFFELVCLIIILIYYKYSGLVILHFNLSDSLFNLSNIISPLGLSFIIFESISYLVDVYLDCAKSGNLLNVALFISFFPKIVSGPIVLWRDFYSQIDDHSINIEKMSVGIQRIIIGVSKKVLIADILGLSVNNVWNHFPQIDQATAWISALCFMMQIYFDFSGYSDVAIGLCNVFGFNIKKNFDYPYLSTSISEFWRRWHISLGTWFRNYVYIPLGGNRYGNIYLNLFLVFVLTGIWHGSSYTFVLWGVIQGLLVVFERKLSNCERYKNTNFLIKHILTLLIVYFSWILFNAPNVHSFIEYIKIMFGFEVQNSLNFTWRWFFDSRTVFVLSLSSVLSFVRIDNFWYNEKYLMIKYIILIIIFILSIVFIVNSNYSPFLYFRF